MTWDRKEFTDNVSHRIREQQQATLPAYRMIANAGVVASHLLTDREHWDRFLSLLQGFANGLEDRKKDALSKIPDATPEELRKLQVDIIKADAMMAGVRLAMELPKALHEGAEQAQEIIDKYEKANETTETKA